jgi:hypothetical protein
MKARPLPLIATLIVLSLSAFAQQDSAYRLHLKSGSFVPKKNITADFTQEFNRKALRIQGQSFAIIQFDHIPTEVEKQQLLKSGISLFRSKNVRSVCERDYACLGNKNTGYCRRMG